MTGLIRSWKESCAVFAPKNFKLFFLAVLNTYVQSLVPFLLYFGIFLVGSATTPLWLNNKYFEESYNLALAAFLISAFSLMIASFGMYAAVRPSVARKNARYFLGFGFHFFWFVIFEFLFRVFFAGVELTAGFMARFFIHGLLIAPMVICFFFFLLDSRPSVVQQLRNLKSAFLFVVYNLPFCLTSGFAFFILPYFVPSRMKFTSQSTVMLAAYFLFWVFTTLFILSWFCVMYTKRVYEQYELYK
jgi:hypothetical protein